MKRREMMKRIAGASLAATVPGARLFAAPEDYTGRFFVTLQADGAWDVSSFCDPKVNQVGAREITAWSRTQEIQTAGNINYAPYGNNAALFDKYYNDMLVINGIDAQTNSHTTGVLHNWSGRNSAGYPSLTAMFAAANGPGLPLAYLNYGGYAETSRLIRYTRLDDIGSLLQILTPNVTPWDDTSSFRGSSRLDTVVAAQQARLERLRTAESVLPREKYAMDAYYDARANTQGLEDFAQVLPAQEDLQSSVTISDQQTSSLLTQIQITTLAFKSGAACSADLHVSGFDTHSNHDAEHEPLMAHLADAIDYLWTYAEEQGIADRLTVLIASDFARTPYYNSTNGKDHWSTGSAVVMEKGAAWGNRVVGLTDGEQEAQAINTQTLQPDASGTIIYPKHLHKSLRTYLGLDSSGLTTDFPFNNTEDLDFFNAG